MWSASDIKLKQPHDSGQLHLRKHKNVQLLLVYLSSIESLVHMQLCLFSCHASASAVCLTSQPVCSSPKIPLCPFSFFNQKRQSLPPSSSSSSFLWFQLACFASLVSLFSPWSIKHLKLCLLWAFLCDIYLPLALVLIFFLIIQFILNVSKSRLEVCPLFMSRTLLLL